MTAVVVDPRFEGPPQSANGGYVAGLLAARLPAAGAAEVTLRRPVPLGVLLELREGPDGVVLLAGDEELASARRAPDPDVGPIPSVSVMAARAAALEPADVREHPFPRCFGCGPERDQDEAVALHPGPLRGRHTLWATTWEPSERLPHDAEGRLEPGMLWVALDCSSAAAAVPVGAPPHVLGRLAGRVDAPVAVGEEVVVLAWPLDHHGRGRWGASAVVGPDGDVRAVARATWIELRRMRDGGRGSTLRA